MGSVSTRELAAERAKQRHPSHQEIAAQCVVFPVVGEVEEVEKEETEPLEVLSNPTDLFNRGNT